jgi:hypothetical protein
MVLSQIYIVFAYRSEQVQGVKIPLISSRVLEDSHLKVSHSKVLQQDKVQHQV